MKKVRILAIVLCLFLCVQFVPQQIWAATTVKGNTTSIAKVTGLKAGVTTVKSINIHWEPITGVSGYVIYRAAAKDGKFTNIKTVGPGSQAFCNITVQMGKEYFYKVRGFVRTGDKTTYGKFSKVLRTNTKPILTKMVSAKYNVNIRKQAGVKYAVSGTVVKGTKMKVLCEAQDVTGAKWYRVQVTIKNKKCTGYVRNDLVN